MDQQCQSESVPTGEQQFDRPESDGARATWHRPVVIKIDLRRTLLTSAALLDGVLGNALD